MTKTLMAALLAGVLSAPALAQTPPPPPAAGAAQALPERPPMRGPGRAERGRAFGNMSPEGRQKLAEAMRAARMDRTEIIAQRDRINALIEADRLDVAALRRAMAEERRLVDQQHARRQEAMLSALQAMRVEDRKAFAASAREGRARAEGRAEAWRNWADRERPRRGDGPPPVN